MSDNQNYPGTPRWVKVLGMVVAGVAVAAVLLMIFGGGQHGPLPHFSSPGVTHPEPAASGN